MGREGDWKKATDSRRHQYRAAPPPAGGPSPGAKGTSRETQERGNSPSFLNPWLRPRSWLSPMKTSKTLTDSRTHAHTHRHGVQGHDRGRWRRQKFDSCDPSGRIGNEGRETTERIRNASGQRGVMKAEPSAFCFTLLSAGLLSLCRLILPRFCSLPGRVGMFLCVCVCVCVCVSVCPERFHACASLQRTCSVSSTAESVFGREWWKDWGERERQPEWKRDDRKKEWADDRKECVIAAFSPSNYCIAFSGLWTCWTADLVCACVYVCVHRISDFLPDKALPPIYSQFGGLPGNA